MFAAGSFALLELLDQLLRGAINGSVLSEERALPGDLFRLLFAVTDGNTRNRPCLDDLVKVPPNVVAVPLEYIQLVLQIVDRLALNVPPEGRFTISPCAGRLRNSPLQREPNWFI